MTLNLTFIGKSPVAGADPGYVLWSYRIDPTGDSDLTVGQNIALSLPGTLDIQEPQRFPGVPELAGMFGQKAQQPGRQYVGRPITTAGAQTIAFVAPSAETMDEVMLVVAESGRPWAATGFAVEGGSGVDLLHLLPCPTDRTMVLREFAASGTSDGFRVSDPAGTSDGWRVPDGAGTSDGVPGSTATGTSDGVPGSSTSDGTGSSGPAQSPKPDPAPGPGGGEPAPAGRPAPGRPPKEFSGNLPYASEMFGVYQPLAGWLGRQAANRAEANAPAQGEASATPMLLLAASRPESPAPMDDHAVLSPVGMVNLFRQFFFEFDTFLGPPAGHLWLSPGGTVEVVETSTRRTLVEKSVEQSEEIAYRSEQTATSQDDVADAVRQENARDTRLGVSATAGANFGVYHGEATGSFSIGTSVKKSSERTHKHTRIQSAKVSSEIKRNFKTTFKTVTDNTDTTSRRYVVQNTTDKLVNYELRRKMRKVGVQVQHIGSRLSWQIFLSDPGRCLGLGDLVQVVPAPDLSSLRRPEPPEPLQPIRSDFTGVFMLQKFPGTQNAPHVDYTYLRRDEERMTNDGDDDTEPNTDHIVAGTTFHADPPAPGYTLSAIRMVSAKTHSGADAVFKIEQPVPTPGGGGGFDLLANVANFGGGHSIHITFSLTWNAPSTSPAHERYQRELEAYEVQVAHLQQNAYAAAVRDRLKLVSGVRSRPEADLRREERHLIYSQLLDTVRMSADPHLDSELIRQIFDVEEMLYFAAPDYWRPGHAPAPPTKSSTGRYPVPMPPDLSRPPSGTNPLDGDTVASWYSHTEATMGPQSGDEYRVNYLITEETRPAPMGSSLGWLIQIDGDERRNEFLNAAWAKVVVPIRPGQEVRALEWLARNVDGREGLNDAYPFQEGDPDEYRGETIGEVLHRLAESLRQANTDMANTLAAEKVFEHGFDPLDGGFRPAEPYQVFDQWIEVLPTDQIVAVEVEYDPKTGQQK